MTKQDFISRVLLVMNEADNSTLKESSYIGADTTQMDRYIEGSFVDAWRRCATVMPRSWLGLKAMPISQHSADVEYGVGYVVLPEDFYLLYSFKMKGWVKSVIEASIENDKVNNIQSNEWTRGSMMRPTCVISNKVLPSGKVGLIMRYYSLPKRMQAHEIEEAIYVPSAKDIKDLSMDDTIDIDIRLLEPLAYLSASSVFTILEKYEVAKAIEQKVLEMFPSQRNSKGTYKQ